MSKGWQVRWYILFALVPLVLVVNGVLAAVAGIDWAALGQGVALTLFLGGAVLLYRDSRREFEQQRMLLHISEGLLSKPELGDLLDYIVAAILRWVPLANKCVIHLLDEHGRRLYPRYSSQPDWQRALGMPADQGVAGRALQERTTQVVDDVRKSPEFLPLQSSGELRSLMVAPLHAQGRPLGTISLNSSVPKAFTERDRTLVTMLAAQASAAILQSQLYSAARRETHHVETILNNLTDGVMVLDGQNRILRYNFALVQLLGLDQRELVGRQVSTHSPDLALRRLALLLDQDSPDVRASYTRRLELAEPTRVALDVYVAPVLDPDKHRGKIIILRDRTEELDRQQTLSELLAAAAWELRSPANTVRGYATLLANSPAPDGSELQRWGSAIRERSARLTRLGEDLADLAAASGEGLAIAPEPVELDALVAEAVDAMASLAAEKGLTISVQCPSNLPPIPLDHDRLCRVIQHLLENSIRRSAKVGEGGDNSITVQVEVTLEELTVTVSDDGEPLSSEARARIFGTSYRADGACPDDPTGTGLGLYVSRRIIEAHRGHLWVPEDDRRARFQFIVPIQFASEEAEPTSSGVTRSI